jgi:HK97 family phage major capsid protein
VQQLAKLKDGEGRYLWQESTAVGQPDRLQGFPVDISEYAPNTFTTGLYVGLLGDWKTGYMIVDALTLRFQRLVELYALTNQIGIIGRLESDGMPVLEEAFVRVKLA